MISVVSKSWSRAVLVLGPALTVTLPLCAAAQVLPDYVATAGMIEIGVDPVRPEAEIFHVDYIVPDADPATRPVTFL